MTVATPATALASRSAGAPRVPLASWVVVLGGIAAALHVGKLPPAVPALQAALQISLLQAGFLLSLVQLAGLSLGLVAGLAADLIGLRRCMLLGLALLGLASALGGVAAALAHPVGWLLGWRAVESVGFLMAVMPGPGLIRRLTPVGADKAAMGLWGSYMPLGVALGLLLGPWVIGHGSWPAWWLANAGVAALAALAVLAWVPPDPAPDRAAVETSGPVNNAVNGAAAAARPGGPGSPALGPAPGEVDWRQRLSQTLRSPGPWLTALAFGMYASQWMAVIGFLPTIYAGIGLGAGVSGALTAVAAGLNMVGNVGGGRLLQRGWPPHRLLALGFIGMALMSCAAFVQIGTGPEAWALPGPARYLAVCLFSLMGGVVPATLFLTAARLAPGPHTVSTTIGLVQQASSFGQFISPPAVAWLAHLMGGWQWTWLCTATCSLVGLAVSLRLRARKEAQA